MKNLVFKDNNKKSIQSNLKTALANLLIKINYYLGEENPRIDNFFDKTNVSKRK